MGLLRFLFKWSLQITGSAIVGYNYFLKPEQQADLYGLYRSTFNSYRAAKLIYASTNQYKELLKLKQTPQEYNRQLQVVNQNTAKLIQQLCRTNKSVYMRFGQFIGHLRYTFPNQFHNQLKQLYQRPNYQAEDYKYLKTHIEAQLGKKTKQLFESLITSPIKTDLFYQIYKGQLAQNFLDVNLKVINPYAKAQAKYDFWFLNKAKDYINSFQQKNFPSTSPLYLNLIYSKLKESVEKQLTFKEQQKNTALIKQKLEEVTQDEKQKIISRPVYFPHIYKQYTKDQVMIQQYYEGKHLSDVNAIIKQNPTFVPHALGIMVVKVWNDILQKSSSIVQSYQPFDLFLRKSRATESGPFQLCLSNFSKVSQAPSFLLKPYDFMWKQIIQSKKIDQKKPLNRLNLMKSFYQNLPKAYFSLFLNQSILVKEICQKAGTSVLSEQARLQLLEASKQVIGKQLVKKLQDKKFLPVIKTKTLKTPQIQRNLLNLKKVFEIEYQPWNLETIYQTYKEFDRQQKSSGVL